MSDSCKNKMTAAEALDRIDIRRAEKMRKEYGAVGWLVSWEKDEENNFWIARLSCPQWPTTVEGFGHGTRCVAIDSATRHLLDLLHKQSQEQKKYEQKIKDLLG
jgi:hypothetical protein